MPSPSPSVTAPPKGEPRGAPLPPLQNDVNAKSSPPHRNTVQAGRSACRGVSRGGYVFGARERDNAIPLWLLLSCISCQYKKYPRRRHMAATTSSFVKMQHLFYAFFFPQRLWNVERNPVEYFPGKSAPGGLWKTKEFFPLPLWKKSRCGSKRNSGSPHKSVLMLLLLPYLFIEIKILHFERQGE